MTHPVSCHACAGGDAWHIPLSMAFQPIVDLTSKTTFAQEALVRGASGESAGEILSQVAPEDAYHFDQTCRKTAIQDAVALGLSTRLHVNFLPNAIYQPETCIRITIDVAKRLAFPLEQLTFEVVESEKVSDIEHLREIFSYYKQLGFQTALDDFGDGHSGFNLLAEVQPDFVKLDLALVRNIDSHPTRRAIARSVANLGAEIGFQVIGEGVETPAESACLLDCGIALQQGYLFARPGFQTLPTPTFPQSA